ncbi:MAG: hypothetical protein VW709_12935, partial [Rickettsiales bacterium]
TASAEDIESGPISRKSRKTLKLIRIALADCGAKNSPRQLHDCLKNIHCPGSCDPGNECLRTPQSMTIR